jgi:RND family efflux transporter MFP subunit
MTAVDGRRYLTALGWLMVWPCLAQPIVETVRVTASTAERKTPVTGELLPFQQTPIHARLTGYVESVLVDVGSQVREGQLLAVLSAPEMKAQLAEAEAKVLAVDAQRAEAEARLLAAQSTYERLKAASATPGAIAGNELIVAENTVAAARAAVQAVESSKKAAQASVQAIRDLMAYLRVTAPFAGVITDRIAHPGALVGPSTEPLFRLQQISRLRLVAAIPENSVGVFRPGTRVAFTVPAYPGELFYGTVARNPRSMDAKTRTLGIELDVVNPGGRLTPGMYPEVSWPVRRGKASLLVPPTAIVTTTEKSFVIRVRNGRAEWVTVRRGQPAGELVEIFGPVREGDEIVRRATDEIRDGAPLRTKLNGRAGAS